MSRSRPAPQGGEEEDVFSRRWRRMLCNLQHAGACKKVKRRANRRYRRVTRVQLASREGDEFL